MRRCYPMKTLASAIMLIMAGAALADSDGDGYVEFNSAFISRGSAKSIDLNRYAHDLPAAGVYPTDIIVNGKNVGSGEVTIRDREDTDNQVSVCVSKTVLSILELNFDQLSKEGKAYLEKARQDDCIDIEQVLAHAPTTKVSFDSNALSLNLELPQVLRIERPNDYVNPALWDHGITAATLGYRMNYTSMRINGKQNDSFFNYLDGGVNIAGWHFRHNGSYTWQKDDGGTYRSLNNYIERDIQQIQGRVVLGDANTKGELFDTIAFRGIKLENEEQMLPSSLRGYAPTIRGTARTSARVIVRQNGNVIYEKAVAPGPFEINDLYPTGYGGNLDVNIEEADGSIQRIQVPYSSISTLLRPGTHKYSVTYGKVRKTDLSEQPEFLEATYQRGVSNNVTIYGGAQGNRDYQAVQGGLAVGTRFGAFSFDVTHSNSKLNDHINNERFSLSGQSYQLKYSQNIAATKSDFSLAAFRFSTSDYMDFKTAATARKLAKEGFDTSQMVRPKTRLSITANQQLPEGYGQFYVSAYAQSYWDRSDRDRQYQMGYSNNYKGVGYSFNVSRNRDRYGGYESTYQLNFSVPITKLYGLKQVGLNLTRGPGNMMSQQLFMNGSAGRDDEYTYGVTASNANNGGGSSGSLSAAMRSRYATFNGLAGVGSGYQTYSAGMSGAFVAHSGGVTLSPYTAETYALIEAKGAEGAKVSTYTGIQVDGRGYALVPYLSAYQMNQISIDPTGTSDSIEFSNTSQKVAPYRGAVVKVKYDTLIGYPVLITAQFANGDPVPFGADVYDVAGNRVGIVGQGARLFARVQEEQGRLKIAWGDAVSQQCYVSYMLPKLVDLKQANTLKFTSICQ